MDARCGKTWLDYLQAPHTSGAGGTNAALNAIEIATWDDYDEGTEMETGVGNCVSSFSASLSGTTFSWTISFSSPGDESTIDHYAIFYSTDGSTGQNITKLADVAVNGTGSYSYTLPTHTTQYNGYLCKSRGQGHGDKSHDGRRNLHGMRQYCHRETHNSGGSIHFLTALIRILRMPLTPVPRPMPALLDSPA